MAQKYFTSELIQKNPKLKSLGFTLYGSPYSLEDVEFALFFTKKLSEDAGRAVTLEALKTSPGALREPLIQGKSLTFHQLFEMLVYTKYLIDYDHLENTIFGREVFGLDAIHSQFGIVKESKYINDHIRDAILILELLVEAKNTRFREISTEPPKPDEETPPAPTPPPVEDTTSVVAAGGLGGSGSTKDKKKKDEKEEEKKKKEDEEKDKKPSDEKLTNDLKTLAQADRQLRHEIFRIQSAITHQLAAVYGISESQYAAFEQEIARHVSPIVYTHIQKLSGEELAQALTTKRVDLYLQSLSSLQRNPIFQHALLSARQAAYKKQIGRELTPEEIAERAPQMTLGQVSQVVAQQYDQVLAKEDKVTIQDAGIPLSAEQVAQIVAQHNVSADTVESSLRAIFETYQKQGEIPLTTSQLDAFFIKLQSYGISKRYSSALSETDLEKFYDAFSKSFGGDSNRIMRAIQTAAGIDGNRERSLFANLLLGYSDRVALDAYHNSLTMTGEKNLAALYKSPDSIPPNLQAEVHKNLESQLQALGHKAVGLGFYTPLAQLHAQLGSLRGTPKEHVVANAVRFQNDVQKHGGRGVITMRQKTIYYLLSSVFGFENIQASIQFGDYERYSIFQEAPSYLLSLAPNELAQDYYAPLSEPSHEQVEAQKRADQEKGLMFAKAAAFVFLGPESIEVIDKAWQIATTVRSVVEQLPGGEHLAKLLDFVVFDKFEQMGKFVDFMLKALALAALFFFGSIATALGVLSVAINAMNLSSVVRSGLTSLAQGVQAGAKSLYSGAQSGISGLSQNAQKLFTQLNSSFGAPISTTTVMCATGGIIGTSFILQTVLFSAFLTPRQGAGGLLGIGAPPGLTGFEGCWPTTGFIWSYHNYKNGGGKHAVFGSGAGTGILTDYPGPETAIDITYDSKYTGAGVVYTPFNGTATFYPMNLGYKEGGVFPLGNFVVVRTPNFALLFAHLESFANVADMKNITKDIQVSAGQAIGIMGTTGNSTGKHLHYGLFPKSQQLDVMSVLPIPNQEKVEISLNENLFFTRYAESTNKVNAEQCSIKSGVK